ncbi:MAG: magnesium and cobalt exporter, family [Thermoleophilaceae bacterium]|jgi:CBS domain containing-hemolysin-like protein|nr:magnesium and cobalt exporter, family [Thermoleophilaceae bacterium]
MTELLLLLGVLLLVAANGFFVAAEFALVRAREGRVEQLRDEGRRGAALVLEQIDRIDEYLSACQLGITMASLGIGFLGEPAIASLLEKAFGDSVSHSLSLAISLTIAYLLTTALHITVGEQVPKIYAIVHAERTALRVARPLHWFRVAFNPLIWALNSASNGILRLVGVDPRAEFEEVSSSEDLKLIIARSTRGGKLDPGEAGMLSGVFHLHEQEARQVMTPIPAVVTVDASDSVETALRRAVDSGHTRLVVTEDGNTDRIKGVVHVNSLVRRLMTDGPQASIADSVKDVLIVPETKPLDDLLADLQRERASMAVVVDEYGRTAGIVTIEDIIEEVVGEIADETDPAVAGIRRLANGDWWVRGHVPITDLADYGLELPVDSEAYNSVGGFVFGELGRLPKRGDMVQVNGYSLRVESVRENRVEAVRIRNHHSSEGSGAEQREPAAPADQPFRP